jgi:hypothetical protein
MEFNGDSEGTRLVPFFCLPCRVLLESRRLDGRRTRWKLRVDPRSIGQGGGALWCYLSDTE